MTLDVASRPGDAGDWSCLNPELAARFNGARDEVKRDYGVDLLTFSVCRSTEHQARLYRCYIDRVRTGRCACASCNLAAPPGSSAHERGEAIDLRVGYRTYPFIRGVFAAWGLAFTVAIEDWHVQLAPNRPPIPHLDLPPAHQEDDDTMQRETKTWVRGIVLVGLLNPEGTGALVKFSAEPGGVPPAFDPRNPLAGWSNLADYLGGWPASNAQGLQPYHTIEATPFGPPGNERFCIEVRNLDNGLAYAAFQHPDDGGKPPHRWDLSGIDGTGWFPA